MKTSRSAAGVFLGCMLAFAGVLDAQAASSRRAGQTPHSKQVPTHPPPAIQVVGRDSVQVELVRMAVQAVADIWHDEDLWNLVAARNWLPGPGEQVMSGPDVRRYLQPLRTADRSYVIRRYVTHAGPFRLHHRRTTAVTDACGTTSINVDDFPGSFDFLINTIAHENTHGAGRRTGSDGCTGPGLGGSRFTDGDYTQADLPWLISYAFGDLAECYYEHRHVAQATMACFQRRIDGECACRARAACCPPSRGSAIASLRRQLDECLQDTTVCRNASAGICAWTADPTQCPGTSPSTDAAPAHEQRPQ